MRANFDITHPNEDLADLTWLNTADVLRAIGIAGHNRHPLRGALELAIRPAARRFAAQLQALDHIVGSSGLQAGGAWICGRLAAEVRISGAAIPASGPVLLVANHPGLLDAAALFSAIPRHDLRVPAIVRPFLRSLPHITERLIPVGTEPTARSTALRNAARHLRSGGALLTFPAGQIEADPLTMPNAVAGLIHWRNRIDALWRMGGRPPVIPLIVGGAIAPWALKHPFIALRRTTEDERRWMAAILQLLMPQHARACVEVRIGSAINSTGDSCEELVLAEAQQLMESFALSAQALGARIEG